MKTSTNILLPIVCSLAFASATGVSAETGPVPMTAAIDTSLSRYPDLVLAKAELERERGQSVYEIELASADGTKRELYIDATTGQLVREHEEYDDDYDGMGQVLAFPALMETVKSSGAGEIREVELDEERGTWIYEVTTAAADGKPQRMFFDAASGKTLEGDWD